MSENQQENFRDGVSQGDRLLKELKPDYVAVDERTLSDLLEFVQEYAKNVNYYDISNSKNGDWSNFFPSKDSKEKNDQYVQEMVDYIENPEEFQDDQEKLRELSQAHLALLFTFLKLLEHPQQQFKDLTERYLDFYYKDVLQLTNKTEVADRVNVIFELVPGVEEHLIEKGTLLNAGVDSQDIDLHYQTDRDINVNQAQVASIKTLFVEKNQSNKVENIYTNSVVDANEGEESELQLEKSFLTLGSDINNNTPIILGFAVSSPVLFLPEGKRTIILTFEAKPGTLDQSAIEELQNNRKVEPFDIYLSSGAEWIQPQFFSWGIDPENSNNLQFKLIVDSTLPPILPLNLEELNEESDFVIEAPYPIIKILLKENEIEVPEQTTTTEEELSQAEATQTELSEVETTQYEIYYEQFKSIELTKAHIQVKAENIQDIKLRNDNSVLDSKAAFELFGNTPKVGSGFYFTNQEVSQKKLETLTLRMEWIGLPDDFSEHYRAYYETLEIDPITNTSFKASLKLLNNKNWVDIEDPKCLFNEEEEVTLEQQANTENTAQQTSAENGDGNGNKLSDSTELNYQFDDVDSYAPETSTSEIDAEDPFEYSRYFKLELEKPDFGHDLYPIVLNQIALSNSTPTPEDTITLEGTITPGDTITLEDTIALEGTLTLEGTITPGDTITLEGTITPGDTIALEGTITEDATTPENTTIVYPPYTPEVKTISLDYTSSVEINLPSSPTQQESDKVFQIHPFGYYVDIQNSFGYADQYNPENQEDKKYLLPQYENEGRLYIGLRNLKPPKSISILFQMIPGSGNKELEIPQIYWHYLDGNSWKKFEDKEIVYDSTSGLLNTGIIQLGVLKLDPDQHILPNDLYWLRASVEKDALAIPETLDIKTQAVSATFLNQGNAADHFAKPLPANSIQGFVIPEAAIKIVKQPATSFGGKPEEDDEKFITRVSERLRHKHRAITAWDYERLVLEEFSEIYKVKCITATENKNPAAANVTVVVIPDISNTTPLPEEPKAPLYLLKQITDFLTKQTSAFVTMEVKNPEYIPMTCKMRVVFSGESNQEGEYINKLNEELKQFFAPWAYDQTVDIPLGRYIEESLVINFIAQREYVHYVDYFEFKDKIEMQPDWILISAENHEIQAVAEPDTYGIGYMAIGDNFKIN
ncbi:MAG: hypothetical protein F6K40_06965 [Okeania sp. SIO3I5]|uniref:baseplate J/gp47 family protein n=1 Tax=Okeania sp. SIO3I5 TaxID=2607805 RepID=UPI0013BAEBD0|nr:baseplate J/gp47 family protein [Okeania sp. SIO3I5]NEQ36038.1 hypothetical protein [Okeania sp. SIO3I5]